MRFSPARIARPGLALLALCAAGSLTRPARADVIDTFDAMGSFQGGQSLGGTLTVDTTTGTINGVDLTVTGQPDFYYVNNQHEISSATQLLQLTSPANETVPGLQFPSLSLLLPSSLVGYGGGSILTQATGTTPGLNIPIQYSSGIATLDQTGPGNLLTGELSLFGAASCGALLGASSYNIGPGGPVSSSGQSIYMTATFIPGLGDTLAQAATTCGFTAFDFQQQLTKASPTEPVPGGTGATVHFPISDPPPGGDGCTGYPYYYDLNNNNQAQSCVQYNLTSNEYTSTQLPSIASSGLCLPGHALGTGDAQASILVFCDRPSEITIGDIKNFETDLVGILPSGGVDILDQWTWNSNYYQDGNVGGVNLTRQYTDVDPSVAGVGGVTLLTVDGVAVSEPKSILLLLVGTIAVFGLTRYKTVWK